jgi:hypothetical protein
LEAGEPFRPADRLATEPMLPKKFVHCKIIDAPCQWNFL